MEAAFDMSMFHFETPTVQTSAIDIPQHSYIEKIKADEEFTSCDKLIQMLPKMQARVEHLRRTVKVSVHFRRNVRSATDNFVPSSIRIIFAEYGKNIKLLLQYIRDLPMSGRKLDLVLFRTQDECKYNIVRMSENEARLSTPNDNINTVENFDMRMSLQKLIERTTRGQVDVFARGDLYQHENIVFATAQLILFHWCRSNAVIEYVLTQVPTDIRAASRKRKSAVRHKTSIPRKECRK